MRITSYLLMIFVVISYCDRNTTGIDAAKNRVRLFTDKTTYSRTEDTIMVSLENNTSSYIVFGLRCNTFLETEYQRMEKSDWSEAQMFSFYKTMFCATFIDTLESGLKYKQNFLVSHFDSTGTYRLLMHFFIPATGSVRYVFSNTFELK